MMMFDPRRNSYLQQIMIYCLRALDFNRGLTCLSLTVPRADNQLFVKLLSAGVIENICVFIVITPHKNSCYH